MMISPPDVSLATAKERKENEENQRFSVKEKSGGNTECNVDLSPDL